MEKLIATCGRHARLILAAWCLLAAVSGVAASQLRLNSDLERLLPEQARSVRNLERLGEVYGQQLDRLTLLIEGDDPEQNLALVESLSRSLEELPGVITVEWRRPTEFFVDNRLLYMDLQDAESIAEKMTKRLRWERKVANPFYVSLGNDEAPEIDFSDIEQKYRERLGGEEYLTNEARTGFAVSLELDHPSDQIDATARFDAEQLEPALQRARAAHPGPRITKTGRYMKRLEQRDATARDLSRGTGLAFLLIVAFLVAYFRSVRAPLLVGVPLILGTLCTFGATWLAFGTLNILTGFVGSVLLGLGIDYGIHLAARYRDERARTESAELALTKAFVSSGKASLYAGITTVAALGSLALSSFQAFYEFGLLSLIGMTFTGAAYATLFPALVLLSEGTRFGLKAERADSDAALPGGAHARWGRRERRPYRIVSAALIALAIAIGLLGVQRLEFEWDFHRLMPEGLPAHTADSRLEALGMGRVPGVILVEDEGHARAVAAELEGRRDAGGDGEMIDRAVMVYDLLPEQPQRKLKLWRDLEEEFAKIPARVYAKQPELEELREEVNGVLERGPIELPDLPKPLTQRFARKDDPDKWIMLVFPRRIIHDARDAIAYSSVTSKLPAARSGGAEVDAIGEEAIMRDIVHDLERDTLWMLGLTLASILIVALLAFRRASGVLLLFANIGVGFLAAMGLIGLLGVKFNFINIIILPIWLGLGVDASFHMMTRVAEDPEDKEGFWHTVRAVGAAFGTTMIGFGGLMISSHRGLASLGYVAVAGLGAILVLSVAVQLAAMGRGVTTR